MKKLIFTLIVLFCSTIAQALDLQIKRTETINDSFANVTTKLVNDLHSKENDEKNTESNKWSRDKDQNIIVKTVLKKGVGNALMKGGIQVLRLSPSGDGVKVEVWQTVRVDIRESSVLLKSIAKSKMNQSIDEQLGFLGWEKKEDE